MAEAVLVALAGWARPLTSSRHAPCALVAPRDRATAPVPLVEPLSPRSTGA